MESRSGRYSWSYKGYNCLILRCCGHLNGYVEIPNNHILFNKGYSEPITELTEVLNKSLNSSISAEEMGLGIMLNALSGEKVWNYTTGSTVDSSPTVEKGYVYAG